MATHRERSGGRVYSRGRSSHSALQDGTRGEMSRSRKRPSRCTATLPVTRPAKAELPQLTRAAGHTRPVVTGGYGTPFTRVDDAQMDRYFAIEQASLFARSTSCHNQGGGADADHGVNPLMIRVATRAEQVCGRGTHLGHVPVPLFGACWPGDLPGWVGNRPLLAGNVGRRCCWASVTYLARSSS
jgi:hypothetical protein